jgi:WD40 repeat protein
MTGDGHWAVSGSGDKMLRLWHLTTGQCAQVFSGHTGVVTSLAISPDGRWVVSGSHDQTLRVWEIEWDYEFPARADWDDAAIPFLENFLALHTPYQADLPCADETSDETITRALTRSGSPRWTEDDFQGLLATLRGIGFGWLRPDGVRKKLQELIAS